MSSHVSAYAELLELRKEAEARRRHAELMKNAGIVFYKPHEKQDLFHRAGKYKRRLVRSGNRFGKSTCGTAETVSWLLGYRPFYSEGDPARYEGIPTTPVKGILVCADWDKCEEIFTCQSPPAKLFQFLPKDSYTVKRNQSGKVAEIFVQSIHGGISVLYLDTVESYKRSKLSMESSDWDFAHIDEPIPEGMWKAIARGFVDRNGAAWFCCTLMSEPWINDRFLPGGNIRDEFPDGHVETLEVEGFKVESWLITGSMHDNSNFGGQQKANFIAELTPEERETRIDGRPSHLTGCVYKEFSPHLHVYRNPPPGWLDYGEPPLNYTIRIAADTHPKNPHAVLFAATAPSGRVYFWSEIYDQCLIPDLCEQIHDRLAGRWPLRFLLELAAFNDIPTDGVTISDIFINAGFPVEPATKDLSFGIMRVKSELCQTMDNVPDKPAKLQFSPHLTETMREFDRYVWDPDKGKPVDKHDHMMENLYRLVLTGLEYVSPEPFRAPRITWPSLERAQFALPAVTLDLPTDSPSRPRINTRSRFPTEPPSSAREEEMQILSMISRR